MLVPLVLKTQVQICTRNLLLSPSPAVNVEVLKTERQLTCTEFLNSSTVTLWKPDWQQLIAFPAFFTLHLGSWPKLNFKLEIVGSINALFLDGFIACQLNRHRSPRVPVFWEKGRSLDVLNRSVLAICTDEFSMPTILWAPIPITVSFWVWVLWLCSKPGPAGTYLELVLEFLLDPFGHMDEGDLPLPELWADLQIQLWGDPKAIPAEGRREKPVLTPLHNGAPTRASLV